MRIIGVLMSIGIMGCVHQKNLHISETDWNHPVQPLQVQPAPKVSLPAPESPKRVRSRTLLVPPDLAAPSFTKSEPSWVTRTYNNVVLGSFWVMIAVLLAGGFWLSRQTLWDEDIQKGIDWGYKLIPTLKKKRK